MPQLDIVENYADNNVLTQAQLHQAMVSIENFVNLTKLDDENIQSGAVNSGLIAPEAVTTEKIAASSVLLSKLANEVIQRLNPAGSIQAYGGDVIPNGYLLCDGSPISRTTFPALFGAIGTKHGSGDGSTTFNLPDYRGRFLRGKDFGTARDPDAASRTAMATGGATGDSVGSIQGHEIDTHTHDNTLTDPGHTHLFDLSNPNMLSHSDRARFAKDTTSSQQSTYTSLTGITITNAPVGGNETRPINANVNWIIKT